MLAKKNDFFYPTLNNRCLAVMFTGDDVFPFITSKDSYDFLLLRSLPLNAPNSLLDFWSLPCPLILSGCSISANVTVDDGLSLSPASSLSPSNPTLVFFEYLGLSSSSVPSESRSFLEGGTVNVRLKTVYGWHIFFDGFNVAFCTFSFISITEKVKIWK